MKPAPGFQDAVLFGVQVFESLRLTLVEEVLAEVAYLPANETSLPVVLNRVIESIVVVDRHDLKSEVMSSVTHPIHIGDQSDFFRTLIVLLVTRHLHESVRLLDLQLRFTELP